jgi:N-acetylglucosaminyldiphosphoundecaprenol N-acetyl-beta-D-mannosaminyltransferase
VPAGASTETLNTSRDTPRVVLFGIPIDNLTLGETVDRIEQLIRSGPTHQHVVINVDKIVKFQSEAKLREAILDCDLINADGQPVVWASRLLGKSLKERVTGIDLFSALIERCAERGFRPYLLGARQEIVEEVGRRLRVKHPNLNFAGIRNGYWRPEEETAVVTAIRETRPDILFVAMSSPKKEMFLLKWKGELSVPFVMGVGGTFDVVAGFVKRAPKWMQQCGLEWLYRLAQEPRRLWRRYFLEDMRFLALFLSEWRATRRRR